LKPIAHSRSVWLFPLFVLLVIGVYADPLFLRRNFAGRDLLGYHLPVEFAIHDAYSRGRLPLWLADVSGGRPLLANPNTGALYPIRPLLSPLPFPVAFRLFPVMHWILAGWGVLLWTRSLGTSLAGAWIGAVTYVFSGVSVCEVFYTNIQPGMVLLPWILWSVARGGSPARKTIVTAILLGLDFLAGDVFTIGLAIGALVLWVGTEMPKPERRRAIGWVAASVALGLLFAAPQWLASLLWAPQTHRGVLGLKLRDVLGFSVSPLRLLEFLVPFPFGPTWSLDSASIWGIEILRGKSVGFFTTFYCGAFALICLSRAAKFRGSGMRFALSLLLLTIAAAVLPSFIPSSWGELPSPLPLRFPEKFCVALPLGLSIVAATGLDYWRRHRLSSAWALGVGAGLAVVALLCRLFPIAAANVAMTLTSTSSGWAPVASRSLAGAFAEAGILWMATVVAMRGLGGSPGPFLISLGILTLAPIAANRRIAHTFRQEALFAPPAFVRYLDRKDPEGAYRVLGIQPALAVESANLPQDIANLEYSRRNWQHYTQTLWHRGSVLNQDLDLGDLSRTESLRQLALMARQSPQSSPFFGSLSLRWAIRPRGQRGVAGYQRVGGDFSQDWDELPGADPDIRLLDRWIEESDASRIPGDLPSLAPGEVVLETEQSRPGTSSRGQVRVRTRSPEKLVIDVACPAATWLFVLRGYWDYRSVRVDGLPAEVVPAQVAFSAVAVPSGRHHVEWQEELPAGEVSWLGPLLFLAAILVLWKRTSPIRSDEESG
jgi:hypothetical protein